MLKGQSLCLPKYQRILASALAHSPLAHEPAAEPGLLWALPPPAVSLEASQLHRSFFVVVVLENKQHRTCQAQPFRPNGATEFRTGISKSQFSFSNAETSILS